jgi:uncharacterized protein (TIGR02147 family)
MEVKTPALTGFDDYRGYLKALFEQKKKLNPRFSFRRFAEIAGFKSPNYLQLILEGKRNLSPDTAGTLAERFKFSKGERDYFVALVKIESAPNEHERNEAERARLVAIRKILAKDIPAAQKEVFGRWFYLLVREVFLLKNAKADPDWISERLGGCISPAEAANAVELLRKCGLLVATDDGFKPEDPVLDTDDQRMQAALMRKFHADLLKVWAANLEKLGPSDQELGVLNIPIDSKKLPELRRRIRRFQDEIIGWVQDDKEADRVVQLGTYLIPFPAAAIAAEVED